ncbi:hypothetical protein GCM10007100_30950 [Roseibacillus persicicus]|uniref:Uncharacterized protein n=1 Tax=Roseibacillus persicicus TaxID=454148 RepID=A0A918TU73_9BACT|nr:hypothetical protein GCM10007100_30950 [Roseibacillus persicicus]
MSGASDFGKAEAQNAKGQKAEKNEHCHGDNHGKAALFWLFPEGIVYLDRQFHFGRNVRSVGVINQLSLVTEMSGKKAIKSPGAAGYRTELSAR